MRRGATTEPAIRWATAWIRDLLAAAPVSEDFSRLCLDGIRDIESQGVRPLADVLKVIEDRATEIQSYDFGRRIEKTAAGSEHSGYCVVRRKIEQSNVDRNCVACGHLLQGPASA